jgi:hypothetical protein
MLLAVNEARADGADVVNIPAGEDKIVPMKKNEPSPFEGQLFDNDTALRWANWLVQYKQLVKTNAALQKRLCEIDVNLANRKLEIEQEKNNKIVPDLEAKLAKATNEAEHPPFYRTFWFGATVGVTVASLAAVGIAVAASQ